MSQAMEGQIVASIGPALPRAADPRLDGASPCGIPLCLMESGSELSAEMGPVGNGVLALSPGFSCSPVLLEADEVHLRQGEAALVPCQVCPSPSAASVPTHSGLRLTTNAASVVSAYEGEWDGDSGFLLVGNFLQPEVTLTKGDVVGAARPIPMEEPAPWLR